ncbi:FAD-dependent oxidoreductase [Coraliomargarita parva]|uniref:FAD-dependent oxidoreductase n=1 Tax=Coraliomargarita parva TaxID=3014050 RepID=UPI0022B5B897|nr:FAD-dependent oxidoreductase [Coraliomargarita parva]
MQATAPNSNKEITADLVIYGATPSGIMAAVQACRMGKSVALLEPGQHIGGMAASGLGATDIGKPHLIGGLAREFYSQAYQYYQSPEAWAAETREAYAPRHRDAISEPGELQFFIEPKVAQALFERFLRDHKVSVYFGERLDRTMLAESSQRVAGVQMEGNRITSLRTESGRVFKAAVFIDTSYEGDLMAGAGVPFMQGREDNAQFGETLNGIQPADVQTIDPFRVEGQPESGPLPGIEASAPGMPGTADQRLQAYTFRITLTDAPENRIPITQPKNYDPEWYELWARSLAQDPDQFPGRNLFKLTPMPNRKTDSNNHGPFSTDFVGQNYDWIEADYATRQKIWEQHRDYVQGMLWFLGHDERIPEKVRNEVLQWGLPKDEFEDTGHWPWQLYVREARRLCGCYIITEHDSSGKVRSDDPVGMGSYAMDSHSVTRYVDAEGRLCHEGFFFSPAQPYGISYRALIPEESVCSNLIVPVCISATHVAYGSARMEPVFMILGQSAATAAAQAIDAGRSVQAIDYAQLQQRLLEDGQILSAKSQSCEPAGAHQ